jgi:hypothetical protein
MGMEDDFYWCDLSIPIVRIEAGSREEAEALMQEFIDKIAPIMHEKLSWQDADWVINKDTLVNGEWITQ